MRYEDTPRGDKVLDAKPLQNADEHTRRAWGMVSEDLTGTMFEFWQKNRGVSTWRQSFDRAAALAFHETGATDMLIELGYETDPQWWKQL